MSVVHSIRIEKPLYVDEYTKIDSEFTIHIDSINHTVTYKTYCGRKKIVKGYCIIKDDLSYRTDTITCKKCIQKLKKLNILYIC